MSHLTLEGGQKRYFISSSKSTRGVRLDCFAHQLVISYGLPDFPLTAHQTWDLSEQKVGVEWLSRCDEWADKVMCPLLIKSPSKMRKLRRVALRSVANYGKGFLIWNLGIIKGRAYFTASDVWTLARNGFFEYAVVDSPYFPLVSRILIKFTCSRSIAKMLGWSNHFWWRPR